MKTLFVFLMVLCLGTGFALTGQAESDSATLDTVDPVVEVTAPLSGATWYIGYSYDITWTATDTNYPAEPIQILYSTDGGTNYTVLQSSNANSGLFPWVATAPPSVNTKVQLIATDSFGNYSIAENTGLFTIGYVPPPLVTNLSIQQRTDGSKTVDIYYDLADVNSDPCAISFVVSEDDGISYTIFPTAEYTSGDIGADIIPGTGKHIVWVAGNESRSFDNNIFRVRLIADDGTNPPQP